MSNAESQMTNDHTQFVIHSSFRFRHSSFPSSGCAGFASDPAKVEVQVQFLARTLRKDEGQSTKDEPIRLFGFVLRPYSFVLVPDAGARRYGGCLQSSLKWVRLPPASFVSEDWRCRTSGALDRPIRPSSGRVPHWALSRRRRGSSTGRAPGPYPGSYGFDSRPCWLKTNATRARKRPPRSPREAGASTIGCRPVVRSRLATEGRHRQQQRRIAL